MGIVIIAEAGVNHNGSIKQAKIMADAAKKAGADYIKFQTFIPENLVSLFAEKAEYQRKNTAKNESQLDMLKKLALTQSDFRELKEYCKNSGIGFLSSPFDLESVAFLETLNLDFWKIPSGDITNLPYLEKIGQTRRKVVLSTGMCEIVEIQTAIKVLESNGVQDITVLHCNTQYPTPFDDVNLFAMKQMSAILHKPIGYSDHTVGIEVPIAAAALGAVIIEKHFTMDRSMEGPDHAASLVPAELKEMVQAIRNIEHALGNGNKKPTSSECKNYMAARKSIVASRAIRAGELLTEENITVKRPGTGISPMEWYKILGTRAHRNYLQDELIENHNNV